MENDPVFHTNDKMVKVKALINQKLCKLNEEFFRSEMEIISKKIREETENIKTEVDVIVQDHSEELSKTEKAQKTFLNNLQVEIKQQGTI